MSKLEIPFIDSSGNLNEVSQSLDKEPKHLINNLPWVKFPYKPDASFSIAYSSDSILLKYCVIEDYIKADFKNVNDPVYEDTCVEFFIAFDELGYYNLEFNYIGNSLVGFGKTKNDRIYLPVSLIEQIKTHHNLQIVKQNEISKYSWDLTISIPLHVFSYHQLENLKGKDCRVNFYKCGDGLPKPHFLCWNTITSPEPNFHLSEFFGEAAFV